MPPCFPASGTDISKVPTGPWHSLPVSHCAPWMLPPDVLSSCYPGDIKTLSLRDREWGAKNRVRQKWFLVVRSSKPLITLFVERKQGHFNVRLLQCWKNSQKKVLLSVLCQTGCKWTQELCTYILTHPCCQGADGPNLERRNWTRVNKLTTSQKWKVLKVLSPYRWRILSILGRSCALLQTEHN